jgi:endonuclease YncB( thermonuclease family)
MILVLVLAAIVAFLMSTQQSGVLLRLPIWLAGAGFLLGAVYFAWQSGGHDAILAALSDAWGNREDPTDGVLFQALSSNAPATIRRYVTPLTDLLILLGAALGVMALLALTPGEFLERAFVRPLALALIGAVGGAAAALAIVSISLGGPLKLDRYVGWGDPNSTTQVYDGDTFSVGDVSVRLEGIDAPERNQICTSTGAVPSRCGEEARHALADIIANAVIDCKPQESATGRTKTSLGRVLVSCEARSDRRVVNVAEEMVRLGWATPYTYDNAATPPAIADALAVAQRQQRGLWKFCTLQPKVWRDDAGARNRFRQKGEVPAEPGKSLGACAVPVPPPSSI